MARTKEPERRHYCAYTDLPSFFWQSKLSTKRKEEILAWLKTLDNRELDMLQDLLTDTREAAEWGMLENG
jgi:hypothetical protein